jgi:MFS family permease
VEARWVTLAVLTAARVSMAFQFQSFASAAPLLVRDIGIGYADVGFLIGLYMLPGIVLSFPGGLLGQRFGDKRMVGVGLGLMVFGGLLTGFAESYAMLLAGRLLSGIGGVLLNVLMAKMVTDWFAGREIVLAMTIFVNSFPVGIGLALLSLGWLSEHAGWGPPSTRVRPLLSRPCCSWHSSIGRTRAMTGPAPAAVSDRASRGARSRSSACLARSGAYSTAPSPS